jgi:autotransporter adhesin
MQANGEAMGYTVYGGGNGDGTVQTQGLNGTAVTSVNAAICGGAGGIDDTATGLCAQSSGTGSTADGSHARATATNATAIGFRALASQMGAVAIGYNAQATGDPTVAIGYNAVTSGSNSVSLGANATATAINAVALGAGSVASQDNTVSVGSPGNERRITNVAPGINGTDAVNVNQLNAATSNLGNAISDVDKSAKAGTASAMAMASLPQSTIPGRGMVTAGSATYWGQTALAVGLSEMSGNGRWVFKAQASAATRGAVGVGGGLGYYW